MVEKTLFDNLSGPARIEMLEDNCYGMEKEFSYSKDFTQEELEVKKTDLVNMSIKRQKLEEEKAKIMAEYKEKLKPINQDLKETLEHLKHKRRVITEKVYLFDYQDEGYMGIYNEKGELIQSRPLLPDERQTVMKVSRKEGTNS